MITTAASHTYPVGYIAFVSAWFAILSLCRLAATGIAALRLCYGSTDEG